MIPAWLIGVAIAFLILTFSAIWFVLGILYWHDYAKDNYKRAYFLIDEGKHTRNLKAKMLFETSKAIFYVAEKGSTLVPVPHKYGFRYFKHRRRIDIDSKGSLVFLDNCYRVTQSEYNTIIKSLTLGNIGSEIVNAVNSSKFKLSIIIVAIIALIIGALGMQVMSSYMKPKTTQQPAQTQPVQPQQQTTPQLKEIP